MRHQDKINRIPIPNAHLSILQSVTKERSTEMFAKLYKSKTEQENRQLALRQRKNYLALYSAIEQKSGQSLVLNFPSPNLRYLKSPSFVQALINTKKRVIFVEI